MGITSTNNTLLHPEKSVTEIANSYNHAAILSDGSTITWGADYEGSYYKYSTIIESGTSQVFSCKRGFAAIKTDGSVVSWGNEIDFNDSVKSKLTSGVVNISSTVVPYNIDYMKWNV